MVLDLYSSVCSCIVVCIAVVLPAPYTLLITYMIYLSLSKHSLPPRTLHENVRKYQRRVALAIHATLRGELSRGVKSVDYQ